MEEENEIIFEITIFFYTVCHAIMNGFIVNFVLFLDSHVIRQLVFLRVEDYSLWCGVTVTTATWDSRVGLMCV